VGKNQQSYSSVKILLSCNSASLSFFLFPFSFLFGLTFLVWALIFEAITASLQGARCATPSTTLTAIAEFVNGRGLESISKKTLLAFIKMRRKSRSHVFYNKVVEHLKKQKNSCDPQKPFVKKFFLTIASANDTLWLVP
jgi:hypothetical protein